MDGVCSNIHPKTGATETCFVNFPIRDIYNLAKYVSDPWNHIDNSPFRHRNTVATLAKYAIWTKEPRFNN